MLAPLRLSGKDLLVTRNAQGFPSGFQQGASRLVVACSSRTMSSRDDIISTQFTAHVDSNLLLQYSEIRPRRQMFSVDRTVCYTSLATANGCVAAQSKAPPKVCVANEEQCRIESSCHPLISRQNICNEQIHRRGILRH